MAKRVLKIAAMAATIVAVACVVVAAWGAVAEDPLYEGVAVGNKEFVTFRQGLDFRVGLSTPPPIVGLRSHAPTAEELAAEESAWGRPNHWLRLPGIDFSLWWPFSLSIAVLGLWAFAARFGPSRGFPVTAVRRGT